MRSRLFLFILAAALAASPAAASSTINGFSLPAYVAPGYVIGADAAGGGANRHLIATQCSVTINTAGSYAVQWELLAPDNAIMTSSTSVIGLVTAVPDTRTISGNLQPTAALPLQAGALYRLRVRLVNTTAAPVTEDTGTQATGKTYIHLTGTVPNSSTLNVVSEITAVTIDRSFLLETNAARTTIPVTVSYTLHRYDNWNGADDPKTVAVNLTSSLVRDDNNAAQAATVSNGIFFVPGVSSFTAGAPKTPFTVSGTRTIQIDPTAILPPQTYRVEPQISHVEQLPSTVLVGNIFPSAATNVSHFTGQLNFASVITHFSSMASAPTYLPSVAMPGNTSVYMRIAPNANSGTVDGITDHHYGDGTVINVNLDENGIATCIGDWSIGGFFASGSLALVIDAGGSNAGSVNGVTFKRYASIVLDNLGVHGGVTAYLPTGVGWAGNLYGGHLDDAVDFPTIDFNQNLEPLSNPSISPGSNAFYLCEETKPVYVECTTLTWDLVSGEFQAGALSAAHSIRKPLLDFITQPTYLAQYSDPSVAVKRSNDHLYNRVNAAANARVKTGVSGGGELSTSFSTAASDFITHFPHGTTVKWSASFGFINVAADLINSSLSGFGTADPLSVTYAQHCQDALENGCGTTVTSSVTLTSATGNLKLTGDGGLHAAGTVAMSPLSWGAIPKAVPTDPQTYAQAVTTTFADGDFLMAGTFLRGDQNALGDNDGPGVLLLSGFDPANLATAERPQTTPYETGLADYAGINFRATSGTSDGQSTLQGDPYGPYDLTTRSKYYIRKSGVTGIHEAPNGTFPGTATVGGYMFSLTTFGFSFLSNDMEDSRTSGSLDLPDPTDFTLAFTNLRLSCLGALEGFDITGAGTVDSKEFDFWNALFTPYTATFESTSECAPGDGTTLVLGFAAHASHFADAINGSLGINPDGEFATDNNAIPISADVPVRITLPGAMAMIGTTGESYDFFPAQGAYLNKSAGASDGFWSLFGTIDVPFFKDMQVHLHTGCGSLTPGTIDPVTSTPIYLMGGWPSNGWTESALDPFTTSTFDVNHKGYTGTQAAYRKTTDDGSETYLPRAQQFWLELITFDYPVKWSNTAFNFTGRGPILSNFVALETQHELVYLDADNAEMTFGLRYEGLPEISLSNFVFNAVDDATGVSSALVTAAGDKVFGALGNGVDELAKAVSDQADDLLGKALDSLTNDLLDDLIADLKTKINSGIYTEADLQAITASHLGASSDLTAALNKLDDTITNTDGFLYDLKSRLAKIEQGIDSVISTVTIDPVTGLNLAVPANGLLKTTDVGGGELRRLVFESVGKELVGVLSTLVDANDIEDKLNDLIEGQSATLDSVTATLTEVKSLVTAVRVQIESATDLGKEIQDLVNNAAGGQIDIATVTFNVVTAANGIVAATTEDLDNLDELADEWRADIAQKIKDEFYATRLVADIQEAVKERVYDVQASFNEAVDTAFASLNTAIRDALSDVLADLDTSINPLEGSFASAIGAGSITGFAHINGDSLDCLRLDAMVEMNLPDALTLAGYFQIKELDSDGPGTCTGTVGANTVEIMIGVEDASLAWVGLGLNGDVRADMDVKFGISGGAPVSLGGDFELTTGTIDFETFEIYKLGAAVMFGSTENYIAASVGVNFGDYSMAGGIFLGRSCDLEPLELIDPLVSSVITTPTITGIYAYGEATFPIIGGSCFFNISAKVGAGVFYFSEGPTYGGRMSLGVYGEALCVVEVGGEIDLVGLKSGDTYAFAGTGRVFGKAGICPICTEANFHVDFKYTDSGGWDVDY